MTGFGQAQGGVSSMRWSVEVRSWNHRFFEFSSRLPNFLMELEEKIRDTVHTKMRRGKITLSVTLKNGRAGLDDLVVDSRKVDFYVRAIRKIQKKHHLKDPVSINTLLAIPNLFMADRTAKSPSDYWPSLKQVLEKALTELQRAKAREGIALAGDMKKRLGLIQKSVDRIETIAKALPGERRDQLRERIHELTQGVNLEPERLEREVALFAERSDITEELVRLRHHLKVMLGSLAGTEETGKKLDFITQELHRETNTIGSKSQHAVIAEEVIRIKGELERIREQVQNIE